FNNGGSMCYITRMPQSEEDMRPADDKKPAAQLPAGRVQIPSKAGGDAVPLEATAVEPGTAGSSVTIQIAPATGDKPAEDEFTMIVKKGDTEERFENVTFRGGRGAKNVVDTVNKESKLVKLAEKEMTGTPVEKMPAPG